MKVLRNLYDWVLHWAHTPYGPLALFVLAFAESSFFPVPPDVLLIALILGSRPKAFRFALICSIASIIGGCFGYFIGYFLWWSSSGVYSGVANLFFDYIPGFSPALFDKVMLNFDQYGFWYVFTAGFTPIPYKIFTIASGVFRLKFPLFLLASAISRSARFFLVSALLWKFGAPIKKFIDKYFNLLSIGLVVLVVIGFIAVKYLVH